MDAKKVIKVVESCKAAFENDENLSIEVSGEYITVYMVGWVIVPTPVLRKAVKIATSKRCNVYVSTETKDTGLYLRFH
jgi:hypothetical protein